MRRFCFRRIAALLLFALPVTSFGQQAPALLVRGAAVKQKAGQLSPGARISVVRVHGLEEFGTFVRNDDVEFTFYDVDLHRDVSLAYDEVKKIKDGYGGYNPPNHRHVDRDKNLIVAAVVLGGLVVLVIAAAAAK